MVRNRRHSPANGRDIAGGRRRHFLVAIEWQEEQALFPDRHCLASDIVHKGWIGDRTEGDTRAGDEIIHPERRRDESRPVSPWRPAAKRGDINYTLHAMTLQRGGGWTREVHVGFINGPDFRVRRHEPEKGIDAGECALNGTGVAMRALNHFDALADGLGQLRGIAYDDADRCARLK